MRAGLPSEVHFDPCMGSVDRPLIEGRVAVVSVDVLTESRSGAPFCAMRER